MKRFLQLIFLILLSALLVMIASIQKVNQSQTNISDVDTPVAEEESIDQNPARLQAVVDDWLSSQTEQYSLVVLDNGTGQELASNLAEETYFSASLYKLYFAVLAWQDVEADELDLEQNLQADISLGQCLDKMIRESDSPCGEALLAKYDYVQATERLRAIGLPDIDTASFQVSAMDMAVLLNKLYRGELVKDSSLQAIKESMLSQVYNQGLKSGLDQMSVYDKVGFSPDDWHDVAYVDIPGKRSLIIAVLSHGSASGVADLGRTLQAELVK